MNGKRNYSQFNAFKPGFITGAINNDCFILAALLLREFDAIDPKNKRFSKAGRKCKKFSNVFIGIAKLFL